MKVEAERAQSFLLSSELCTTTLLEQNSEAHSPDQALCGTKQAKERMEFSPGL